MLYCQAISLVVSNVSVRKLEKVFVLKISQGAEFEQSRQPIPRLGSYACATLFPLLLLTINRICCLAIVSGLLHGLGCVSQLSLSIYLAAQKQI